MSREDETALQPLSCRRSSCVRRSIRTTYTSFLVPGLALFLGHLLPGEPITRPKATGIVLVICGLALVGRS